MPDKIYLRQMQALPLIAKVHLSQARIREWYDHFNGDVCISFSGGKDSTVLAHLVHEYYPSVPMVFVNTGLEYPEIQAFAKKMGAEFVRPKMRFDEVISKYGYPIISKENAEAIHYARKIRNSVGGGMLTHSDRENNSWGREFIPRQNGLEKSSTYGTDTCFNTLGGVSQQKRAELYGKRVDGRNTEATEETRLFMASCTTHKAKGTKDNNLCTQGGGIRKIGQIGEETALPG